MDERTVDRDVLLVPSDPEPANIKITNSANGKYVAQAVTDTVLGPVETSAGWTLANLEVRGQQIRIIGTHLNSLIRGNSPILDPDLVVIQQKQASELILGPANTPLAVVILGDLNSTPDGEFSNSYVQLRDAGFVDSWTEAHPKWAGPTCCQDSDLLNSTSALSFRIDYALTRGGFKTLSAHIIGEETKDKTPTGLWPSNHAGVVASLALP
jgi:endonuclease/exonuclease/phosphatase family metal-dependent hydrolase